MTRSISVINDFDTERILFLEPVALRYRIPANSVVSITTKHDMGDLELVHRPGGYITIWLDLGPDYDFVVSLNGEEIVPF